MYRSHVKHTYMRVPVYLNASVLNTRKHHLKYLDCLVYNQINIFVISFSFFSFLTNIVGVLFPLIYKHVFYYKCRIWFLLLLVKLFRRK